MLKLCAWWHAGISRPELLEHLNAVLPTHAATVVDTLLGSKVAEARLAPAVYIGPPSIFGGNPAPLLPVRASLDLSASWTVVWTMGESRI